MKTIGVTLGMVLLTIAGFSQTNTFPSSGSAGVGTLSPNLAGWTKALTIQASGNAGLELVNSSATSHGDNIGAFRFFAGSSSTNFTAQFAGDALGTAQNSGRLRFGVVSSGTYRDAMTIDSSGYFGLGTTTPTAFMDVFKDQDNGTTFKIRNTQNYTSSSAGIVAVGQHQTIQMSSLADGYSRSYPGFHSSANLLWGQNSNGMNIVSSAGTGSSGVNTGSIRFITYGGDITSNGAGNDAFTRVLIDSSGRVGIGTITPTALMDVLKDQDNVTNIKIRNTQNNTSSAASIVAEGQHQTIQMSSLADGFSRPYPGYHSSANLIQGQNSNGMNIVSSAGSGSVGANTGSIRFITYGGEISSNTSGNDAFTRVLIDSSGKVGIGTISPSEKLSVNGNVRARKLIITQLGWSDYVFHKNYKLRSLASLESFIKQNKHLPEIPSAKEVEEKGISVGDNQALLLKKIEELTLYVIAQQKEINILKTQIRKK